MSEKLSQSIGRLLINGGVSLVVAVLAFISQSQGMERRVEKLEKLEYPPALYKDLVNEKIGGIKEDLIRHERLHHPFKR